MSFHVIHRAAHAERPPGTRCPQHRPPHRHSDVLTALPASNRPDMTLSAAARASRAPGAGEK